MLCSDIGPSYSSPSLFLENFLMVYCNTKSACVCLCHTFVGYLTPPSSPVLLAVVVNTLLYCVGLPITLFTHQRVNAKPFFDFTVYHFQLSNPVNDEMLRPCLYYFCINIIIYQVKHMWQFLLPALNQTET